MSFVSMCHTFERDGEYKIYRFANNQGASVIKTPFSYGSKEDLWELAVIQFNADESSDWSLDYTTPITSDVIGYLSDKEVDAILQQIEDLPPVA